MMASTLPAATPCTAAARLPAVRRGVAQPVDRSVSGLLDPSGGRLEIGGVALEIPAGALREPVAITLTVPAGDYLQAHLEPHGLAFDKPASLEFALDRGGLDARGERLVGVYFRDPLPATGMVDAYELRPAAAGDDRLAFEIAHFSGYCVAVG